MKPNFTLHTWAQFFRAKKILTVATLLLLNLYLMAAGNPAGSHYACTIPNFTAFFPFSVTESMRSNLYLLDVSNNSTILADGVLTEYNDLYHDLVMLEDAHKFTNINENLGMARYGSTLAVERRPIIVSADTIFFKLWKTTQRNYQYEFIATNLFHPGMEATLKDSYLGTSTPISLIGTTKVNFSINSNAASSNINRFRIIYRTSITPAPLPVVFTSVKAYQVNKNISIDWKVETEVNIARYEVEKSTNGKDFTGLSSVLVNGANNASNSYSTTDVTTVQGNNFYRIRSEDKDGSKKYSQIVKVVIGKTGAGSIVIYPNPIKVNIINLQFTNQLPGVYNIRLINNSGQTVYATRLPVNSSNISQTLFTNMNLQAGLYQVEIKKPDNTIEIQKAIVQR